MTSGGAMTSTPAFPTLSGLFHRHSNSLAGSFSLFSIFKSSAPPLPDSSLLHPLLSLATDTPSDHDKSFTVSTTIKALLGLQAYAQQLRTHITYHHVQGEALREDELGCLSDLMKAYLHVIPILAGLIWDEGEAKHWGKDQDKLDLHQALTQSLEAVFTLRSIISSSSDQTAALALTLLHQNLLGSIFSPPPTKSYLLTPVVERSRSLILALQSSSRQISSKSRGIIVDVSDNSALEALSLLETFASSISSVGTLSGPKAARTKAQKEADTCRPFRIKIEAMIVRTDLAMSMATVHIKEVKLRAGCPGDTEEDKGALSVKWETYAEEGLVNCLTLARTLMDERRGGVLVDHVDIAMWLGGDELPHKATGRGISISGLQSTPTSYHSAEEDEDASSDGDSAASLSSTEAEEEEEVAHPCPLRILFGLHDRFEEQRLAVWLGLPTGMRGGMGAFMRGEAGRVGEEWDALGLELMLKYDSETLMRHGLSSDKVDKWVELASTRNAKKLRKGAKKA